jgi:hypothetical protein
MGSSAQHNQWWRWLLVPVFSIVGAVIGSTVFELLIKFGFSKMGLMPSDWLYRILNAIYGYGVLGWLFVLLATLTAPSRKLQVAKFTAWALVIFALLLSIVEVLAQEPTLGFGFLELFSLAFGAAMAFNNTRMKEAEVNSKEFNN